MHRLMANIPSAALVCLSVGMLCSFRTWCNVPVRERCGNGSGRTGVVKQQDVERCGHGTGPQHHPARSPLPQ